MEKYTVSRELAQKLKDAGYPQKSFWSFGGDPLVDDKLQILDCGRVYHLKRDDKSWVFYAAPLSDELLEQLPRSIPSKIYDGKKAELWLRKDDGKYFVWYYVTGIEDVESDFGAHADMPANALAKLWLWAKENGHLKPKGSEES